MQEETTRPAIIVDADRAETAWHLDKRVNVGHLLTTLAMAIAAFTWAGAMDRRVAVLEEKAATHVIDQRRQDEVLERAINAMREDMREVARKLDRLVEAGGHMSSRGKP